MGRWTLRLAGLLGFLLLLAGQPAKAQIIYTFVDTGTGTIGSTPFTNSPFTITLVGNPNSITLNTPPCATLSGTCTVFDLVASSATFTVDGMNGAFTGTVGIFDNQTFSALGFERNPPAGADIMDLGNSAFATYDLSTAIGPIGPFSFSPAQFNCTFGCVGTTLGDLSMSAVSDVT